MKLNVMRHGNLIKFYGITFSLERKKIYVSVVDCYKKGFFPPKIWSFNENGENKNSGKNVTFTTIELEEGMLAWMVGERGKTVRCILESHNFAQVPARSTNDSRSMNALANREQRKLLHKVHGVSSARKIRGHCASLFLPAPIMG